MVGLVNMDVVEPRRVQRRSGYGQSCALSAAAVRAWRGLNALAGCWRTDPLAGLALSTTRWLVVVERLPPGWLPTHCRACPVRLHAAITERGTDYPTLEAAAVLGLPSELEGWYRSHARLLRR